MQTVTEEQFDSVIVGGGIGGLLAGAMLARGGQRVLILEQGSAVGGYAHAFARGGYSFDPGVHLIADPELFESLLSYLGVRDHCTMLPQTMFYRVMFPGFTFSAPLGREAFIAAHEQAFPHEAAGIRAFFMLCAQVHHDAHTLPAQVSLRDLDVVAAQFPALFRYRRATVQEVVGEFITDPQVQAVCTAAWIYLGLPPSRASFQTFAQLVFSSLDSMFCFEGGVQSFVDAVVAAYTNYGGTIRTQSMVTKILIEEGRARGVQLTDGTVIGAERVLSNADAKLTYEQLVGPEHLPAAFLRTFRRLKPSGSAFLAFAATSLDLASIDSSPQTFVFDRWDADAAYQAMQQGHPAAVMVNPTSLHDPSLAPPGEHVVVGTALVPYDIGRPWQEAKEASLAAMLGQIEVAYPGFGQAITFLETATPITLERYTLNHHGAIHSWEQSPDQIESKRPSQRTPIDGLYLASQWTNTGGSFLRALLAGVYAAKVVRREMNIFDDIPDFRSLPSLS